MTTDTSKIDQLIKTHNPFAGHIVVRPQQIWGKSYPDVPSINAHAANAVFDAIDKIKKGERQTVGITIAADKGLGKSHIISRIRHQLQSGQDGVFIYMSKYDNLNKIQLQFLESVTSSLRAFVRPNVMPFQEIAAALINEAMGWKYTTEQYINKVFPTLLDKHSPKVVEQLTRKVLDIKPEITNNYIIQAFLWTLSVNHVNAANFWLSAKELPEAHAQLMGLANNTNSDKETQALNHVRQILDIVSDYRVPVICFDELDNINQTTDTGFTAAQVIANLSKDLYTHMKTGVLLLAMYPATWNSEIRGLPQAEAVIDRLISEKFKKEPIQLDGLKADEIVALAQTWLQEFYQKYQQVPPHPLYPFNQSKLREFGKRKPTIRAVLQWCAENFVISNNGDDPPGKDNGDKIDPNPVQPFFLAELVHLKNPNDSLLDDEETISKSLKFCFERLIGETLKGVTVEKVEEFTNDNHLDFKIIGNQQKVKIGVDILQQSGGVGVTTALGKLIDYKSFDITRGCLVRSKNINTNATKARTYLRKLLKEQGGEWVSLQFQDIKPLLAIFAVWENRDSYELTDDQIFAFIKQRKIVITNPLIKEILSDPSGQEPDNLTDDGLPISIPQSVDNSDDIKLNI
jgi:hypothetical protein